MIGCINESSDRLGRQAWNGLSCWVRVRDREQDPGRPVADDGPAVPDVGWMADRLAGPSRQEPSFSNVTSISPSISVDRHLAVGLEPAAEVLVRGHAVLDHLEQVAGTPGQEPPARPTGRPCARAGPRCGRFPATISRTRCPVRTFAWVEHHATVPGADAELVGTPRA